MNTSYEYNADKPFKSHKLIDGRSPAQLRELAEAYEIHKPPRGMKLITFTQDHAGYLKGKSQFFTEEQAYRLIEAGVGEDANNGGQAMAVSTHETFIDRQLRFRQDLGALFNLTTIRALEPELARLKREYNELWRQSEWNGRTEDLRQMMLHDERLKNMNRDLELLNQQIEWREPGGKLYAEKFTRLANDNVVAQGMMTSSKEMERRLGVSRAQGLDQVAGEWNTELDRLKARRNTLRG
jgi:hypothetical protein